MGRETDVAWRRSQVCAEGNCVEMAETAIGVEVRDSTQPQPVLAFTAADWSAFVAGLRDGQLRRN